MSPPEVGVALVAGSIATLAWTFLGFPLVLALRALVLPRPLQLDLDEEPSLTVTVVLAAHDEEEAIESRIRNLLELDYPHELLRIIVASDGSTDRTVERARSIDDPRVEVLDLPRGGKADALNRAVAAATGEVIAFTDANTWWGPGTLRALVLPFQDPRVGGVAGDQRYDTAELTDGVAAGEATYWDLDRLLKLAQSRAGSVTSATGAVHAIRRDLVDPVPPGVTDDFFLSTGVVQAGRRLVFAPAAVAHEPVAPSGGAEYARKVRIMTRGLNGVVHRRGLLNPFRHGFHALQLLSHKVLRRLAWIPILLLALGTALGASEYPLLLALGLAQAVFYLVAVLGLLRPGAGGGRGSRLLRLPGFACMTYAAAAVASWNVLTGREIARWGHARLKPDPTTPE